MKWEVSNTKEVDDYINERLLELKTKDSYELKALHNHTTVSLSKIVNILDKGMPIFVIGDYDVGATRS